MAPPTMRTNCAKSVQMTADNPPEVIHMYVQEYVRVHIIAHTLQICT